MFGLFVSGFGCPFSSCCCLLSCDFFVAGFADASPVGGVVYLGLGPSECCGFCPPKGVVGLGGLQGAPRVLECADGVSLEDGLGDSAWEGSASWAAVLPGGVPTGSGGAHWGGCSVPPGCVAPGVVLSPWRAM